MSLRGWTLLATLLMAGAVAAEEPEQDPPAGAIGQAVQSRAGGPLTVDAAVRIGLDEHPLARAAAEGVRETQEAVGEARAPFYPSLGVTGGYGRWETHAFLPSGLLGPDRPAAIGPTNDWTLSLGGRYMLFDSGKRAADLRVALAGRAVADHEAMRVREDLALEVRRAFFALAAALDGQAVAETNLARAREHHRLATQRRSAGAVSGADVVQAQVQVADARLARVRMASLVSRARGVLNTAMGLPVETAVDVVRETTPAIPPDALAVEGALGRAATERPAVLAARERVTVAAAGVEAARSLFGPRIAAEWAVGVRDSEFAPTDRDWRVGVSVTWSLFDGFARQHGLGRAQARRSTREADVERLMQAARQEVWSAHATLQEAYEAIGAAETLVRDAEEGARIARERYRVGAGTVNELLDAQAALARAGAIRAQTNWDYQVARAAFDWSIGQAGAGGTAAAPPAASHSLAPRIGWTNDGAS